MKTTAELQAAIDEIADVCRKHGIALVGTASGNYGLGEITILCSDSPEPHFWARHINNEVLWFRDTAAVSGIGDPGFPEPTKPASGLQPERSDRMDKP